MPQMSKSGLMGMSSEPFYSDAFFHPAENMSFMNPGLANPSLRQSAASTWFSLCQNYYGNRNFQIFKLDTSPLGNKCVVLDFMPEATITYAGMQSTGDYLPLANVNYSDNETQTYKCSSCFLAYSSSDTPSFLKNIKGTFNGDYCTKPPDLANRIDFYGDLYDIDSNLLRAIAQKESNFDHCAVSSVNATPANINLCTGAMLKPSDVADAMRKAGCDPDAVKIPGTDTICALGMMQTTDLPGSMYTESSMPPEVKACGGKDFNPFDANDSLCAGAYKLAWTFLPQASSAVSSNSETLKVNPALFSESDNQNLLDALNVAFAAELYYGYPVDGGSDTYLYLWRNFKPNVDKGSDCSKMNGLGKSLCCDNGNYKNQYGVCGQPKMDPITFYSKLKGRYPKIQYGMDTLSIYMSAIDKCGGCASDSYYRAMCAKIKLYAPNAQCG
jgi:hypothetical protein